MSTPILPLAVWPEGILQARFPANDNALRVEALNRGIISQSVTAQPASPADGDTYIIAATHTGAQWATFTPGDITIFKTGSWYAWAPTEGLVVNVSDAQYKFDGGIWTAMAGGSSFTGGALTSALDEAKGADIARAATTNIGTATGNLVHLTGTTTITGLGTVQAGTRRIVRFAGAGTLTHNATSLILPGAANITTAANDCAIFVSEGSGNWRCVAYSRANGTALVGSGGASLTNFTGSLNTATPNNTVNAARLLVTGGTADVDFVLQPKGLGSLIAQLPDGTNAGGDKRGLIAVDLQRSRTASDQVASGTGSTIPGGQNNKATGDNSFAMGVGVSATASQAFAVGDSAVASAANAVAVGFQTIADGEESMAMGRQSNTRGLSSAFAQAGKQEDASGDRQSRRVNLKGLSSSAGPISLSTGGSGTTQLNIPSDAVFSVEILVSAKQYGSAQAKAWKIVGAITNFAGTVALLGTPTVTVIGATGGASSWSVAMVADNTGKLCQVQATGAAATTIGWSAAVLSCEAVVP